MLDRAQGLVILNLANGTNRNGLPLDPARLGAAVLRVFRKSAARACVEHLWVPWQNALWMLKADLGGAMAIHGC